MLNTKPAAIRVRHPLFSANPELEHALAGNLHLKSFRAGEHVFAHGDRAASLWLVLHGWVKLTRQTPDGKETIVGLCTEGDVLGEAALFANANYPYHAEVVGTDAQLVAIPAPQLRELIQRKAELSRSIMGLMNERMSQAQLKLEHMSTMSAAQRLGCFLLRLCHAQANGAKTLEIPIEKHVLAAYLGMKPETLSRSQQQLQPQGISIQGPKVVISNIETLREFVCGSCSESGTCDFEAATFEA